MSQSTLKYQLKQLCARNRDGSFATQANRQRLLTRCADELKSLGYLHMNLHSLKGKHVQALVKHWQAEDKRPATIKNRMAALRWWAEKINKPQVIAKDNDFYGIERRQYVTNTDHSRTLCQEKLQRIRDPHIQLSLQLQAAFGLRREECLKFQPSYADQGDHLQLKASWCKGGRERIIPIRTQAQRTLLQQCHDLAGNGSMIPAHKTYVQQLRAYTYWTIQATLDKNHGLRHRYAQDRYQTITDWPCPKQGGPLAKQLTPQQKAQDHAARLKISHELGHEREEVTAVYLGR
ncbi:phage integrase N-terminal domain-containing protein [Zooshikella ganghwensis]|uniref:Integrase n=1 Tax=Zooshikella ganghwensis TaxID=202772 RepID=A0A4P9VHE7_9GAMM|nr:phage integrase N-terminal domain-containing protein [Zooshikella ganghwensis]RDH41804.1 integrase [Zooshikella ganghwensis]